MTGLLLLLVCDNLMVNKRFTILDSTLWWRVPFVLTFSQQLVELDRFVLRKLTDTWLSAHRTNEYTGEAKRRESQTKRERERVD